MLYSKIPLGIIGVTGYSGSCLFEILQNHPKVEVVYVSANNHTGKLAEVLPRFYKKTNLFCGSYNSEQAIKQCELLFLAVPHTIALEIVPKLLKANKKVIDLSADYRLKNINTYEKWYTKTHTDKENIPKAVYGIPEFYRNDIKKTNLVANPGCYPTATLLGLVPIVKNFSNNIASIIVDAKSGVTGAGKKPKIPLLSAEVNENIKAYKILSHPHHLEIQECSEYLCNSSLPKINFVPHLIPIRRGILCTIYIQMDSKINLTQSEIQFLYQDFYKKEEFVRIYDHPQQVEIQNVLYTNYCDIGTLVDSKQNLIVITSVIDNLMKGAAGQAMQNMNLLLSFADTDGFLNDINS